MLIYFLLYFICICCQAFWIFMICHEFFDFALRPVTKSPSSLISFCSPSYFPANHCCFACVSFHIPVLLFCPALPLPKSCWACLSRSLFQRTFPYFSILFSHVLPFPPAFPFSVLPFVPVLPMFVHALPLTKSCWACPLQVPPPAYFLPFPFTLPSHTFLYCGSYHFCVCIVFFFPFFLLEFSWKMFEIQFVFFFLIWFLFI